MYTGCTYTHACFELGSGLLVLESLCVIESDAMHLPAS